MSPANVPIVHFVGDDIDALRVEVLETLLTRLPATQRLVLIGTPPIRTTSAIPRKRISGVTHSLSQSLLRPLPRASLTGGPSTAVVHAWSGRALAFARVQCADEHGLSLLAEGRALIDAPSQVPVEFSPVSAWGAVARTACEAARLAGKVCATDQVVIIRSGVDFAAVAPDRRPAARQAIGLDTRDTALLILPPVTRASGAHTAAWAALLADRVVERVRLIVPGGGPEVNRIARLVDSAGRRDFLHLTGERMPLPDLLVACDVAMYLPAREAVVDSIAWAMAAGRPILGSVAPGVTELLADGSNGWLCRPDEPRDAARRLLEIIDGGDANQRRCESAQRQASAVFSRQNLIDRYAAVYANLAAGRPVGAGMPDAEELFRGIVADGTAQSGN